MRRASAWTIILAVTLLAFTGCGGNRNCRDLDNLTVDADDDGFFELLADQGLAPSEAAVHIRGESDLTTAELLPYVETVGLNPDEIRPLLNFVTMRAEVRANMQFGDVNREICQTVLLEPFAYAIESPCPDRVQLDVDVFAQLPFFLGEQLIAEFSQAIPRIQLECGGTLSVRAVVEENGEVGLEVMAAP